MSILGGYDEGPYNGDIYAYYGIESKTFERYIYDGILDEKDITRPAIRIIPAMSTKPKTDYKYRINVENKALQQVL